MKDIALNLNNNYTIIYIDYYLLNLIPFQLNGCLIKWDY